MDTHAVSGKMSPLKLRTSSYRFSLLLCSQLALIVIAPLPKNAAHHPSAVFSVFSLALLLTALNFVAIEKRRLRAVASLLCGVSMLMGLLTSLGFERMFLIPGIICSMTFMVFMIAVILSEVITARTVSREILYGAVSAYLFIGIAWGMAYSLVDLLAPGSILKTVDTQHPIVWSEYMFFSFVTLTTVGYGNMVPIGAVQGLALLEAVMARCTRRS